MKVNVDKLSGTEDPCQYYFPNNDGIPAEPVFVANPEAQSEDDGILLVAVLDSKPESYMAIIDAKTMKEVGRAWLGLVKSFDFHGTFAAASSTSAIVDRSQVIKN